MFELYTISNRGQKQGITGGEKMTGIEEQSQIEDRNMYLLPNWQVNGRNNLK